MSTQGQPNNPSRAYLRMKEEWDVILSLLGGTRAMRAAGEKFLPKYHAETPRSYEARRQRSTLLNYFKKTRNHLASRPFQRPVTVGDSLPEALAPIVEDANLLGADITAFAKTVFSDGMGKGLTHILVDFPRVDTDRVKTKEDEEKANIRPYFVHITAENLIAAYAEVKDGRERLTHIRITESETVRKGFDEIVMERVRVWEPDSWKVYQRTGNGPWGIVEEGVNPLGEIPLVTYYAGARESFMVVDPPLMDLAHKNVEHWQSASDQRNVLTVARFPIITATGVGDTSEMEISPKHIWSTEKAEARFGYLEHEGNAIEAGRKDLEDLKDEMAMMSVDLLIRRTGNTTATEKGINTAQSHSELSAMALGLADALEMAFYFAAKWLGIEVDDETLSVEVNTDFGITEGDTKDLDFLMKARAAKEISHKAFITELKRRGVLAPDFDDEADQDLLDAEGPPLGMMGRPGQAPGKNPQDPNAGKTPPNPQDPKNQPPPKA